MRKNCCIFFTNDYITLYDISHLLVAYIHMGL